MVELALEVAKLWGLPTAFLIVVCWAAWKLLGKKDEIIEAKDLALEDQDNEHKQELVDKASAYASSLAEKDAEIKRLNDARLADSLSHGERMLQASKQSTELVAESNQTLKMLSDRIEQWRQLAAQR